MKACVKDDNNVQNGICSIRFAVPRLIHCEKLSAKLPRYPSAKAMSLGIYAFRSTLNHLSLDTKEMRSVPDYNGFS